MTEPALHVRVDDLPPSDVAVAVHRGPYSGLESCFRGLGAWVASRSAGRPTRPGAVRVPARGTGGGGRSGYRSAVAGRF